MSPEKLFIQKLELTGELNVYGFKVDNKEYPVNNHHFTVDLETPVPGQNWTISAKRYANPPTLILFPWVT